MSLTLGITQDCLCRLISQVFFLKIFPPDFRPLFLQRDGEFAGRSAMIERRVVLSVILTSPIVFGSAPCIGINPETVLRGRPYKPRVHRAGGARPRSALPRHGDNRRTRRSSCAPAWLRTNSCNRRSCSCAPRFLRASSALARGVRLL